MAKMLKIAGLNKNAVAIALAATSGPVRRGKVDTTQIGVWANDPEQAPLRARPIAWATRLGFLFAGDNSDHTSGEFEPAFYDALEKRGAARRVARALGVTGRSTAREKTSQSRER